MVKAVGYWLVYNNWSNLKKIVQALNYLLAQESWASDLLLKHIGKTIHLVLPITEVSLLIDKAGQFTIAQSLASEPNVTLTIGSDVFSAFVAGGKESAAQHVKVSGDVDLAHAMSKLAGQLRWEFEEDLSKLVGDAMAHRIVQAAKKANAYGQSAIKDVGGSVFEYFVHEKPTLVQRDELTQYKNNLRQLRDDVERIEKRIERLLERSQ
jgi:ubiquinone biosynthesis protein UbiJ